MTTHDQLDAEQGNLLRSGKDTDGRSTRVRSDESQFQREPGMPDVGSVIKRLRTQRAMSLRDLAHASGLSQSFLSSVERGESDISLGRLSQIARVFHHGVGSLLGYSLHGARPQFLGEEARFRVNRGRGVRYEAIRIPGTSLELLTVEFEPYARMRDSWSHVGIDIVYVIEGLVTVVYDEDEYVMRSGDCALWSAACPHTFRNDSGSQSKFVAVMTEIVV